MPFSLWILLLVLLLITLRQLTPWKLAIWHIMLGGGIIVLVARAISLPAAWNSIDWNVMGSLLGIFYIGQAATWKCNVTAYWPPKKLPAPGWLGLFLEAASSPQYCLMILSQLF